MQSIEVHRILTRGPGDASGLEHAIDNGTIDPAQIVAVIGKTEGNGCVNDFTRELATAALAGLLGRRLGIEAAEVERRIAFVMSGGTEGVLSPHITVFTRSEVDGGAPLRGNAPQRLAVGVAFTDEFRPEAIGRAQQVRATADAVRRAMKDAAIVAAADLHFVQIKCPLLTSARIADARSRGAEPVTADTYESMGFSRGASALGVALATGELAEGDVDDGVVLQDFGRYSAVASTSAGIEVMHNVVIVMGMSTASASQYVIGHDVMQDAIDAGAVLRVLHKLGISPADAPKRIVNVFAKAEASPDGLVRGGRHTMLNDSDINSTRHARAAVGAVIASVVGHTALYVSGGAEHQGPPGGGPVAVIGSQ